MSMLKPFIINDYDLKKPFASFLPGVAGKMGIPIWSYYVNRGQGIASFGLKDKNGAILEFNPASIAYEKIATNGFRSFIKTDGVVYEPFGIRKNAINRKMSITGAAFSIRETNQEAGYEMEVVCYGLPNAPVGALVRNVKLTNISQKEKTFELLDGITHLLPRGITNGAYKDVGNLMRSWMEVRYLDTRIPYFTMRSSSGDEAEMHEMEDGNFYLAKDNGGALLQPIVDINLIFSHDNAKLLPHGFIRESLEELLKKPQYPVNKVPCAFVGVKRNLMPGESITIDAMAGMSPKFSLISEYAAEILKQDYFEKKARENDDLIRGLTDDVATSTANDVFDEYIRQSYLDNLLRGGYPVNLGTSDKPQVYYLYSRKHGDLERDYNWFNLEPEYYSQGNGNFRDVNQNRRNDILFHDYVGTSGIRLFMNLIQMDGYNPLVINGSLFELKDKKELPDLLAQLVSLPNAKLEKLLNGPYSPGAVINLIVNEKIPPRLTLEEILRILLEHSDESHEAVFGEGYWSDHFTYNLDLIESYLSIYPDRLRELLFADQSYKFYQSPCDVLPRDRKYGLTAKNSIRQYGSIQKWGAPDKEKLQMKEWHSNWHKKADGTVYQTNLIAKLISLETVKFATLDPLGYGISMEADKPGWNDAMNGLPGLLASGVPEAIELLRLFDFTIGRLKNYDLEKVALYNELFVLLNDILDNLNLVHQGKETQFEYWNKVTRALEEYRLRTRLYISGEETSVPVSLLKSQLLLMRNHLKGHLEDLYQKYPVIPTYLTYEVTDYDLIRKDTEPLKTPYGLTAIEAKAIKMRALPSFLEAPARFLKVAHDFDSYDIRKRYELIKKSGIYDQRLKVYKTSDDLDGETIEIGRIRAFTKGWLERESDFMHMTFKYLYGLLKSGMYDEFFDEIRTNMPAFMDPEIYGRSIYENSSFIATSNNPDPYVHGQGFVSRLSGSNTEVLSMWFTMMFGHQPFYVENDALCLAFRPIIPASFFKDGMIATRFLGTIDVIYHNLSGLNTYDPRVSVKGYELISHKDKKIISGPVITGQDAIDVRNHRYSQIKITMA